MSFCVLVHGGKKTTQSQMPSTSKAASGKFTVIVMCYRVSFTGTLLLQPHPDLVPHPGQPEVHVERPPRVGRFVQQE